MGRLKLLHKNIHNTHIQYIQHKIVYKVINIEFWNLKLNLKIKVPGKLIFLSTRLVISAV